MKNQASQIKRIANIVEVISSFVRLKKSGSNYTGLCPFHAEKDPSFTVNEEKGFFYCFGCKAGGDVIGFIKRYRNCTYREAIEELASRYGITLERYDPTGRKKIQADANERLLLVNSEAVNFYHHLLLDRPQGLPGRIYLEKRGLDRSIVREQKLGYAPNRWESLLRHLKAKDISTDLALKAGLIVEHSKGRFRDRFRNRLMFPIRDANGRVVAFGGRAIDEKVSPKYLNSPETAVFHKSKNLYNYHIAREACRHTGRILVVEGYLDLLSLNLRGIRDVVATLGTALTRQHVRLLERVGREAILIFDGDEAGVKAASRSLELFLLEQFPARCVVLPDGLDPDDYIKKFGPRQFEDRVNDAPDLLDFFLDQKLVSLNESAEGKARFIDELLPVIRNISNPVIQDSFVGKVAEKTRISEGAVLQRLKQTRGWKARTYNQRNRKADHMPGLTDVHPVEESIIKVLLHHPKCIENIEPNEMLTIIPEGHFRKIFNTMFSLYKQHGTFDLHDLLLDLSDQVCESILVRLLMSPQCWTCEKEAMVHLENKVGALKQRHVQEEREKFLEEIREAEKNQDYEKLKELLRKNQEILIEY